MTRSTKPVQPRDAIRNSLRAIRDGRTAHLGGRRWTREELAAYLRTVGLDTWTHDTVKNVETGSREVTVPELLVLLRAFGGEAGFFGDDVAIELPGRDVVHFGGLEEIRIEGRTLQVGGFTTIASGASTPPVDPDQLRRREARHEAAQDRRLAESKAAAALGVDVETIRATARTLWRRNLTRQREVKVGEELRRRGGVDARTLQAIRGHVTRGLLKELRSELQRSRRKR